jgi:hypothetical protein
MPFQIHTQTAETGKRRISPGATRVTISAVNEPADETETETPAPIFLCSVSPPNTYEQRFRETFLTVCSVEDIAEYPVGVSSVLEVPPENHPAGTLLFSAQENKIYTRGETVNQSPEWKPYFPQNNQLPPDPHTHNLPFFRRSTIDIILPNRLFVEFTLKEIRRAIRILEKDLAALEHLTDHN